MDAELIAEQEKIQDYVKRNAIKADSLDGACGDGRPAVEGKVEGRVRKFGSDVGDLMAIRAALNLEGVQISAGDLVSKYLAAVKQIRGDDSKIEWHTDEESLKSGKIGCGHAARALTGIQDNLTPQDVRDIWDAVMATENERAVLKGGHEEHREEAVLLIHGTDYSVRTFDGRHMFFGADVDRGLSFIDRAVPLLGIERLTPEDVREQWLKQMNRTAQALAKGKSMFDINFDVNGTPKASFAGKVS